MKKKQLRLTFFYVGDGDAILIEFPNGGFGIIDSNFPGKDVPTPILEVIRKRADDIVFVCLTHPHDDHYSGLLRVLEAEEKRITEFWHTFSSLETSHKYYGLHMAAKEPNPRTEQIESVAFENESREIDGIIRWMDKRRKGMGAPELRTLRAGLALGSFGGVKVECLAPRDVQRDAYDFRLARAIQEDLDPNRAYENPISAVLCLRYGKSAVLLCGDCPANILDECLRSAKSPNLDMKVSTCVIKVPHHGAEDGWKEGILQRWEGCSRIAVISAGSTKHPSHTTLSTLGQEKVITYVTGVGGPAVQTNMHLAGLSATFDLAVHGRLPNRQPPCKGDITVSLDRGGRMEISHPARHSCQYCYQPERQG